MWEDSIRSNMSALQIQPDYFHAADFAVYAHLQLAQDRQAAALIERVLATPLGDDRSRIMVNQTALAAMPARYVIERADWKAAAALPAISTPHPHANALRHFTRGLGLARSGDVAGAKQEIVSLETVRAAQVKAGDSYWADRTNEQILAVTAWIAHAEGADDRAATLMRQAADGEDGSIKHVAMENRLYPLRELLADLLLEAQQPQAALAEYETALKLTPNRYRGIYGAARAAEAAGDLRRAREYYEKLQGLAKNGDRAEMRGRVNKVE
jgi:tetratricopeptide (TPR) repeat protein